ncbi:methionyl-tRNA formyltransferase [Allopseudospirillum japonicum]|uniref:Methionyl-tRNA formyltransferase n=1 Tax=Allopseudospirillum japonicum TaxID=64971 RepID=A0A1H6QZH5_9GAMM|nr:methionyl-tRNA formyltransferase [Allopseudospirillum japonicum]SEI47496.1 methionyl-tRNA formyltransferase [Allopseudospirillum japonicum]
MSLRLVFAGTPEFAATHLQALLSQDYVPVAVYTQPDRPAGRGRKLMPSPVKSCALAHQCPVYQPESLKNPEAQAELAALKPDLLIVVAYGLILPQAVLDIPTLGCINVHASLLPRWRGAAPIQRALIEGDTTTGVTLMQMQAGLDTGPMLVKRELPIQAQDTSASLHDALAELGAQTLVETLPHLAAQSLVAEHQDESQVTYAHKLTKAEAQLDWRLPASQLARYVRGYNPWPMAWTLLAQDQANPAASLRIWQASVQTNPHPQAPPGSLVALDEHGVTIACAQDALRLEVIQFPGKKAQAFASLAPNYAQKWPLLATRFACPEEEAIQ